MQDIIVPGTGGWNSACREGMEAMHKSVNILCWVYAVPAVFTHALGFQSYNAAAPHQAVQLRCILLCCCITARLCIAHFCWP